MLIPDQAIEYLKNIAFEYRERTIQYFPKSDTWKNLSNDDIWKLTIYQVVVVGNSSSYDRLINSNVAQEDLKFEYINSLSPQERKFNINRILRSHGVRYASADLHKCRKTNSIHKNFIFLSEFIGGPIGYVKFLSQISDDRTRISQVEKDLSYIKLKGSRDLLGEIGIAEYLIALDYRILTILAKLDIHCPENIKTNKRNYMSYEDEILQRVCMPIGISGVKLDRILYRNYNEIMAKF